MVAARVDRGHKGGEETLEASGRLDGENRFEDREETGETGPGMEEPGIGEADPGVGQPEIGESGPGTEKPGTEETGSGAGADPGDTPDGWRWTKLGDGGILKRQIPMDEAEDIQISYILTDLNVEVTDSEEILLEEEYVVCLLYTSPSPRDRG